MEAIIRALGKRNNGDKVGKDTYHHTFLKMAGNWFFEDNLKAEAVAMVLACLTEEFKLDPEQLYPSYFKGNTNTMCNNEAQELWLWHLLAERVLPFWMMGSF